MLQTPFDPLRVTVDGVPTAYTFPESRISPTPDSSHIHWAST